MFGSSSTTRSRASGSFFAAELVAGTIPPDGPGAAVVVMPPGCAARLRYSWTVPVRSLGNPSRRSAPRSLALAAMFPRLSAGGSHRPAASPVADGVVLVAAEPPAPAQVGPDRTDGRRLGADPGEHVVSGRSVQLGHGVGEQGAGARGRTRAGHPAHPHAGGDRQRLPPPG